jgi:DnaJ like chaperone protein
MGLMGGIFGGTIGFALGGPLGGMLGAVIGHKLGEGARAKIADAQQQAQAAFFITTFSMLGKLAKADGQVSRDEIVMVSRFMRDELGLSPDDQLHAQKIFNEAKNSPDGFEDYARQFATIFGADPRMRAVMLDLLTRLAAADGQVHPAEEEMLRQAAHIFGLSGHTFDDMVASRGKDVRRHYATLGLPVDASEDEIKSKYRRLVVEYHPDKVVSKGLPEEFVELAEKKLREIQEAYEAIKQERGMR